ncbi:MAG: SDR family NAD(P)-dependent oxidoreductase [Microthrixaceae bacterium]|nr:SDR family NAD(P)-dependent oxidoreductase [Microthrixaceae bacterium]MCO5318179.1 SDR family NAD(P)-dependent oxidoreductase [Microthrixaceae bacterium]
MRDALGEVQSVLVLGGGSDIGRALVTRLARRRCHTVVLAGRPEDDMDVVAEAARNAGATTVETIHWEATDVGSHDKVIGEVFATHGDIDLVYAPAGILGDQAAFEADPEFAAKAFDINTTGLVSSCLVVARHMREQGHGAIVLMSSVAGVRARKDNFVYGATKAGLDAFGQGLGDSLAGEGIRVMVVRPGFVHSKMTEGMEAAPFSTTPDKVAEAITNGLAKGSETVWVPGLLAYLFFVFRNLPRPIWRKVSDR